MRSSLFWDVTKRRLIFTAVSALNIGPIFTVEQTVFLELLALEDRPVGVSRNFGNYKSKLRNVPEEQKSHWHRGGNLKQ